jgi:tape measure domain-containing protein
MLGDISSGAGTDLQGLVSVFNQVRGKGKLSAEEFQQFAERGVAGLREEIAKFKGISLESVGDSLSAGAVSAEDLESVFQRMTGSGGIFFQAMERQSETFMGKLSTLGDAWTGLQIAFAAPINDALKPIIEDAGTLVETLTPAFEAIGQQVATSLGSVRDFVLQLEGGSGVVEAMVSSFGDLGSMLLELVSIPIASIVDALPELGAGLMLALVPAMDWLLLKLQEAAFSFGAAMQTVLGDAVEVLKSVGSNVANDFLKFHPLVKMNPVVSAAVDYAFPKTDVPSLSDRAQTAREKASGVDTSGIQEKSFSLISEAMAEILTGMSGRLDAFQSGTPYVADGADIGRTIADSFIDRLADAAGAQAERGNVNTANTATSAAATDSSAAINKLESILNELQRINTQ